MLGQDTEFFVFDTKEGRAIPAHKIGVEQKKTQADYYGSYFRDGYAVEFNSPPATCRAGLWENLARAMAYFKRHKSFDGRYTLITDPIVPVDLSEIDLWPSDLKVLGCNPTFDPYIEEVKAVQVDPLTLPFRTSGGHLHYSFAGTGKSLSLAELGTLSKYCDLTIGLIHTVVFGDDKEFHRRSLYGGAGEFRDQKYKSLYGGNLPIQGFEYRVLSSRLYNHPGVFGLIVGIFKYMLKQYAVLLNEPWNSKLDDPLRNAINTGAGSTELLEELGKFLTGLKVYDATGMNGIGYIPKDWGAAILKLREMRLKNGVMDRFQMWEGQLDAHWGWSEYNDHKTRSSTVSHMPLIKEDPWLL